jgi:putative transposase
MDRKSSHTTTRLTVHIVWVTKYRYHVLKGDVQQRCRDILVQICDSDDVKILKGVVSKDRFAALRRSGFRSTKLSTYHKI